MAPKLQGAVQEAACGIASYEEGEKSIFGCNFSGDFPSPRDVARFQFTRKKFLLHQPGKLFFSLWVNTMMCDYDFECRNLI